jgi:2-polyprenyl-3-methyl-5-hydroxy-6-metoxy-1,4-benzoquinol methylase
MSKTLDRATFENAYAGKVPWDIGKLQGPFIAVADRVSIPVLDAGGGTGDTALFFAARGHRVTGIDFADEAIRRARVKAAERGLSVEFLVKDALTLGDGGERFASVIDSGLFHVFSDDDR